MRIPIIAGNWKMYKTIAQAIQFVKELKSVNLPDKNIVIICPPATALHPVYKAIDGSGINLGAQNMHHFVEGAYTGEVSPVMLKDAGCRYVILGHSERRQYFAETNENVNIKVKAALENGLTPIVCVGETLEQREVGGTTQVITEQVKGSLEGLVPEQVERIILAYEPVWAIGTGRTASSDDAQQVNGIIRGLIADRYGDVASQKVPILYGGSVKPENAGELMAQPDVDGALVGGASLDVESFAAIIKAASCC